MKARTYMLDGRPIPICISDEAVREWEAVRELNQRTSGYPDRPPDVDTPTVRAWVIHPGETGYQAPVEDGGSASYNDAEADWSTPYETLVFVRPGSLSVKFLSGTRDDEPGFIITKVRFEQKGGGFTDYATYRMPPDQWEEMKRFATDACVKQGGKVLYTGPNDFAEMLDSYPEIEKAIAEWYRENGNQDYSKGVN